MNLNSKASNPRYSSNRIIIASLVVLLLFCISFFFSIMSPITFPPKGLWTMPFVLISMLPTGPAWMIGSFSCNLSPGTDVINCDLLIVYSLYFTFSLLYSLLFYFILKGMFTNNVKSSLLLFFKPNKSKVIILAFFSLAYIGYRFLDTAINYPEFSVSTYANLRRLKSTLETYAIELVFVISVPFYILSSLTELLYKIIKEKVYNRYTNQKLKKLVVFTPVVLISLVIFLLTWRISPKLNTIKHSLETLNDINSFTPLSKPNQNPVKLSLAEYNEEYAKQFLTDYYQQYLDYYQIKKTVTNVIVYKDASNKVGSYGGSRDYYNAEVGFEDGTGITSHFTWDFIVALAEGMSLPLWNVPTDISDKYPMAHIWTENHCIEKSQECALLASNDLSCTTALHSNRNDTRLNLNPPLFSEFQCICDKKGQARQIYTYEVGETITYETSRCVLDIKADFLKASEDTLSINITVPQAINEVTVNSTGGCNFSKTFNLIPGENKINTTCDFKNEGLSNCIKFFKSDKLIFEQGCFYAN